MAKDAISTFCVAVTHGLNGIALTHRQTEKNAMTAKSQQAQIRSPPLRKRAARMAAPPRAARWQPRLWTSMSTFSGTAAMVSRPATFTAPPQPTARCRHPVARFDNRAHTPATLAAAKNIPDTNQ